ncbi:MAG: hypothetical protein M1831_001559 [Alyxoria varia]|nr:MAG: hypothetical protein M1831_001559 [Alyxoria varia]
MASSKGSPPSGEKRSPNPLLDDRAKYFEMERKNVELTTDNINLRERLSDARDEIGKLHHEIDNLKSQLGVVQECIKPTANGVETIRGAVQGNAIVVPSAPGNPEVPTAKTASGQTGVGAAASRSPNLPTASSAQYSMALDEAPSEAPGKAESPSKPDSETEGRPKKKKRKVGGLCDGPSKRSKRRARAAARNSRRADQNHPIISTNAHASSGQIKQEPELAKDSRITNRNTPYAANNLRAGQPSGKNEANIQSFPRPPVDLRATLGQETLRAPINENGLSIYVGEYREPGEMPPVVQNNPALDKVSKEMIKNTSTEERIREIGLNRPYLRRCLYTTHHRNEKDLRWAPIDGFTNKPEDHKCQFCAPGTDKAYLHPQCIYLITERTIILKDPTRDEERKQREFAPSFQMPACLHPSKMRE